MKMINISCRLDMVHNHHRRQVLESSEVLNMPLNKYIPDDKLPAILKRPLVFGDRKQIDALNCLEIEINKLKLRKAKTENNWPVYFDVAVK